MRALFQSGMRLNRQGRYQEAAGYFEAMLQQDPSNTEASEMLAEVKRRLAGGTSAEGFGLDFGSDPGAALFDESPLETLPPASKGRKLGLGLGAFALLGLVGFAAWSVLEAEAPAPVRPNSAVQVRAAAQPPPADPVPVAQKVDAGLPAELPGQSDAGRLGAEAPNVVSALEVDAGQPESAPPDAGLAEPTGQVAATPTPPEKAEPERAWTAYQPLRRGRVTMAQVKAPAAGAVSWSVAPEGRVERGAQVGTVQGKPLVAGKAGVLIPKVPAEGPAKKGELLANIVYHEGFVQAEVTGATPKQGWFCEVLDESTGQRAPCKVITVVRKGAGFLVTATTEPLWFDGCKTPRLRLAPP